MRFLIVIVEVVALQSCSRSTSALPNRQIRIAVSRDAITWLPLHLARQLGYCQQQGLALTLSEVAGLSKAAEVLLGGSLDVAGGSLMLTIQLAAEGRSVRTFLTFYTATSWDLVVAPAANGAIRTFADLKGHRVGVSFPGSPTHLYLNDAVKKAMQWIREQSAERIRAEKVRTAQIDLSRTYTNEFAAAQ